MVIQHSRLFYLVLTRFIYKSMTVVVGDPLSEGTCQHIGKILSLSLMGIKYKYVDQTFINSLLIQCIHLTGSIEPIYESLTNHI